MGLQVSNTSPAVKLRGGGVTGQWLPIYSLAKQFLACNGDSRTIVDLHCKKLLSQMINPIPVNDSPGILARG